MEKNMLPKDEEKVLEINDVASCFRKFKEVQKGMEKLEADPKPYVPGKFIFRGVSDEKYHVLSSAGRRLKELNKQNDFIRYHVNLVSNARKMGYGKLDLQTELSDLEILAEIQHLGGATCLTDFTTNFLIALWFATSPKEDADGKLVWLDLGQPTNFRLINYCNGEDEKSSIQKLLKGLDFSLQTRNQNKAEPCFWLWEPPCLNSRIMKQNSVFLFGLRAFPTVSDPKDDNLKFGTILIPNEKKKEIREELEHFFGISAETVFHDFSGYSLNANDVKVPVSENILSTRNSVAAAKENIKKREYSLAVNYLDEAIECLRCRNKDNYECKRKINGKKFCCYTLGEIAFWRGRANADRGYIDEAILNYYEVVKHLLVNNENHGLIYDAYRELIYLYYDKDDFKSAMKMAECLWKLYLEHRDWENNGHDVIFYLLELSILTCQEKLFDHYVKEGEHLKDKFVATNGSFLWVYFESIGKAIFSKDISSLKGSCEEIESIIVAILNDDDHGKNNLIGHYYWDFEDMINWIKSDKNNIDKHCEELINSNIDKLSLFTEKANEAQSRLVNHVFANSVAFSEEIITSVTE